jgi:hypothetical protein
MVHVFLMLLLMMLAVQVRWFSFQFLMQQLAEEIKDMHTATQLVLAALPKPPKKRPPGTSGLLPR